MSKRVIVTLTGSNDQKFVSVSDGMSFDSFLEQAGGKLSITAKRAFTSTGVEVDDISVVRDDDVLTITDGSSPNDKKKKGDGDQLNLKIAVIGSGGVGKSAITLQYVQGRFIVEYDPTIEDAYRKQIKIDDRTYCLDILDTAGQEDYWALRGQWMINRDGFVLVYSVSDRRTFEDIEGFHEHLREIYDPLPPLVIMANKCDVDDSERQVSKFEGEQLTKSYKNALFFESSAKTRLNIDKAFAELVREIKRRQAPPKKKGPCTIL